MRRSGRSRRERVYFNEKCHPIGWNKSKSDRKSAPNLFLFVMLLVILFMLLLLFIPLRFVRQDSRCSPSVRSPVEWNVKEKCAYCSCTTLIMNQLSTTNVSRTISWLILSISIVQCQSRMQMPNLTIIIAGMLDMASNCALPRARASHHTHTHTQTHVHNQIDTSYRTNLEWNKLIGVWRQIETYWASHIGNVYGVCWSISIMKCSTIAHCILSYRHRHAHAKRKPKLTLDIKVKTWTGPECQTLIWNGHWLCFCSHNVASFIVRIYYMIFSELILVSSDDCVRHLHWLRCLNPVHHGYQMYNVIKFNQLKSKVAHNNIGVSEWMSAVQERDYDDHVAHIH